MYKPVFQPDNNFVDRKELTIGSSLGSGSFSNVYRATYQNQPVAFKQFKQITSRAVAVILNEVRILQCLPTDPCVPRYLGHTDNGIIMTVLEGDCLGQLISEQKKVDLPFRVLVMRQIALAYQFLTRHGVYQIDINPSNILVKKDGSVSILDFGFAQTLSDRMSVNGLTVLYTAPEVFEERIYYPSSQIYSIAYLYWSLLSCSEIFPDLPDDTRQLQNKLRNFVRPPLLQLRFQNTTLVLLIFYMWRQDKNLRFSLETCISILDRLVTSTDLLYNPVITDILRNHPEFPALLTCVRDAIEDNNLDILRQFIAASGTSPSENFVSFYPFILHALKLHRISCVDYFCLQVHPSKFKELPKTFISALANAGCVQQLQRALQARDFTQEEYDQLFETNNAWLQHARAYSNWGAIPLESEYQQIITLILQHPYFTLRHFAVLRQNNTTAHFKNTPIGNFLDALYNAVSLDSDFTRKITPFLHNLSLTLPAICTEITKLNQQQYGLVPTNVMESLKTILPKKANLIDESALVIQEQTSSDRYTTTAKAKYGDSTVSVKKIHEEFIPSLFDHETRVMLALPTQFYHPKLQGVTHNALVMAYFERQTLKAFKQEILNFQSYFRILTEVATALSFLHAAGIIYNAINEESICMYFGSPILSDCSQATIESTDSPCLQQDRDFEFFAPERFDGIVSKRTDVFAFAILCWKLQSNEESKLSTSYAEAKQQVQNQRFRPSLANSRFYHPVLVLLMLHLWQQEADLRFSMSEALAILDRSVTMDDPMIKTIKRHRKFNSVSACLSIAREQGCLFAVKAIVEDPEFDVKRLPTFFPKVAYPDTAEITAYLTECSAKNR